MKKITYGKYKSFKKDLNKKRVESANVLKNNIKKIAQNKKTQIISYSDKEYSKSFKYVEKLYPNINLKEVTIFLVEGEILKSIGYNGIGGFFDKINKNIVVAKNLKINNEDIFGKITVDEVIVHELLHYVSDVLMLNFSNILYEEEFAYSNSIEYLRKKGYTNHQIIQNNFLPFLYSIVDTHKLVLEMCDKETDIQNFFEKNKQEIREECKKIAYKYGEEIIKSYDLLKNYNISKRSGKQINYNFDLMDF